MDKLQIMAVQLYRDSKRWKEERFWIQFFEEGLEEENLLKVLHQLILHFLGLSAIKYSSLPNISLKNYLFLGYIKIVHEKLYTCYMKGANSVHSIEINNLNTVFMT